MRNTYSKLRKNPTKLLISVGIDVLFLVLLIGLVFIVEINVVKDLEVMAEIVEPFQQSGEELMQDQAAMAELLSHQDEISAHYRRIGNFIMLLLVGFYVLTSLFQGLNWSLAHGLKKAKEWYVYIGKMFGVNFIWGIFLLVLGYIFIRFSSYQRNQGILFLTQSTVNWVLIILLGIIVYLALTSYVFLAKAPLHEAVKNSFLSLKKKKTWILFLANTAITVGAGIVVYSGFLFQRGAGLLLILIIFFPIMFLKRLYLIESTPR